MLTSTVQNKLTAVQTCLYFLAKVRREMDAEQRVTSEMLHTTGPQSYLCQTQS